TIDPWATNLSAGPGESGQTLSFTITDNTNAGLFSAGPAIDANGVLTFTPAADANGSAAITVELQDDGGTPADPSDDATSDPVTFTITLTPVNDAPSFTPGADVTVAEDAAAQTIDPWATNLSAGPSDESAQTLSFTITNNTDPSLFSAGPAIDANGVLTFTPAADAVGSAAITVELQDNGGTLNPGDDDTSDPVTFTITITSVNDAPSFTPGADVTVAEDAAAQTIDPWATNLSAGPGESGQTLSFTITDNTNAGLFSAGPAIDANGVLTFTPAADANGSADITVELQDDGGTPADPSDDATSDPVTFTITLTPVNDAPVVPAIAPTIETTEDTAATISLVDDLGMSDDRDTTSPAAAGAAAFPPVASITVTGAPSDGTIDNIDITAGTFDYTPNPNYSGSDSFTIEVCDLGTPGSECSSVTVDVTITPVNDAPSFTPGADVTVAEDAAAQTIDPWATSVSPGPGDESGQILSFGITNNTDPSLFSAGPAIDANGVLTFTPAADANGSADITVELQDDGGTPADPSDDATSAPTTFTITLTPVNDAPSFTSGADPVTVDEDSGAYSATWATNLSAGPSDESAQTLSFNITGNTDPSLFSAGPAIDANGVLTFTPAANVSGSADITVELQDNGGTANPGDDDTADAVTFTITIAPVNDPPIADDDSYSTDEESLLNIGAGLGVLVNDTDIDGAVLRVSGLANPVGAIDVDVQTANGTLRIRADGSFTYLPNLNSPAKIPSPIPCVIALHRNNALKVPSLLPSITSTTNLRSR
ncbi:MAG: tandem-95 repeat protein, partial [Blastochloris sp.]|nr:tandem-95 repeat protein [Blastochloris sp.]